MLLVTAGCGLFAPDDPPKPKEVDTGPKARPVPLLSRGVSAMGTLFEITVVGEGADAEAAIAAAFDEIRRVEDLLTVWKPGAPLLAVNVSGPASRRQICWYVLMPSRTSSS